MKLKSLFENKIANSENDDMDDTPSPGKLGEFITTAQAAVKMKVSMSRVRQLIMTGAIKSYAPEKGRRDNIIKLTDIRKYIRDQEQSQKDSK